jgi:hypothetical protein
VLNHKLKKQKSKIYTVPTMSERRNILANDDEEDSHGQEPNLGVVFDQHIKHEFQEHDVETTMEGMIEPYVHHVPMMTGGVG